jgi:tRNA dimethylallyltransferase
VILNIDTIREKIIVICGATATGKSAYALELAKSYNGVIINADAMQIYKGLPIITAQPSETDLIEAPHTLYDYVNVDEHYSVGIWIKAVIKEIENCTIIGKTPIIVGGSGLYIKSLVDGLAIIPDISSGVKERIQELTLLYKSPELHSLLTKYDLELARRLAISDSKRITRGLAVYFETGKPLSEWQKDTKNIIPRRDFFIIYINTERQKIYNDCDKRLVYMIENGAIDEVKALIIRYPEIEYPKILGLREIVELISGNTSKIEALKRAQQATRNYAKRQITWFKHQLSYDIVIER